jgi:hypothetical protein
MEQGRHLPISRCPPRPASSPASHHRPRPPALGHQVQGRAVRQGRAALPATTTLASSSSDPVRQGHGNPTEETLAAFPPIRSRASSPSRLGRPARGSPPPSLPFFTRQGRRCSAAVFTAGEQADGFHGAAIVFSLASKAEPTVHNRSPLPSLWNPCLSFFSHAPCLPNSRSVGRPCRGHGVLTRSLPVRGGRRCLGRFQLCATASNSDSYIAKVNLLPIIPLCSLSLSMHWPVRSSRGTCWRPRSREASWGVDVQYSIHEVPAILQIGPWAHSRITRYVIVGLDF